MRFVKPLDEALLMELAETHDRFVTLEEHSLAGGFGSAVVECVADRGLTSGRTDRAFRASWFRHNKPNASVRPLGCRQRISRPACGRSRPHFHRNGRRRGRSPTAAAGRPKERGTPEVQFRPVRS